MIQLADAAMGRDGRMLEVIQHTGRDLPWMMAINENTPFELSIGVAFFLADLVRGAEKYPELQSLVPARPAVR
jgi:hypothetical protein